MPWKTNEELPKMFGKIVFEYNSKLLSGTFKDLRMGLSYEEHSRRMINEGRKPVAKEEFDVNRYYVDCVEYFGYVDWEDVVKWAYIS